MIFSARIYFYEFFSSFSNFSLPLKEKEASGSFPLAARKAEKRESRNEFVFPSAYSICGFSISISFPRAHSFDEWKALRTNVLNLRNLKRFPSCKTWEIEKDIFFCLVKSVGQRKNSESPWGIEPQTFRFRAPKFIWHALGCKSIALRN